MNSVEEQLQIIEELGGKIAKENCFFAEELLEQGKVRSIGMDSLGREMLALSVEEEPSPTISACSGKSQENEGLSEKGESPYGFLTTQDIREEGFSELPSLSSAKLSVSKPSSKPVSVMSNRSEGIHPTKAAFFGSRYGSFLDPELPYTSTKGLISGRRISELTPSEIDDLGKLSSLSKEDLSEMKKASEAFSIRYGKYVDSSVESCVEYLKKQHKLEISVQKPRTKDKDFVPFGGGTQLIPFETCVWFIPEGESEGEEASQNDETYKSLVQSCNELNSNSQGRVGEETDFRVMKNGSSFFTVSAEASFPTSWEELLPNIVLKETDLTPYFQNLARQASQKVEDQRVIQALVEIEDKRIMETLKENSSVGKLTSIAPSSKKSVPVKLFENPNFVPREVTTTLSFDVTHSMESLHKTISELSDVVNTLVETLSKFDWEKIRENLADMEEVDYSASSWKANEKDVGESLWNLYEKNLLPLDCILKSEFSKEDI